MTIRSRRAIACAIVLLGFALLIWQLDSKSLWVDELFTADVVVQTPPEIIARAAADLHPPLYFLVLHVWVQIAGTSEFALRLLSVFAATIALALTWQLGRKITDESKAQIALLALAVSPPFIEFSRMARYYSLVLLLGVAATFAFSNALRRNRLRDWVAYLVCCSLLIYTFYPSATLILAHGLTCLLDGKHSRQQCIRWLLAVMAAFVIFIPMWLVLKDQIARAGQSISADLAGSLSGLVLALTWPFYVFAVGETIFPWIPIAIPALLAVTILVVLACYKMSSATRSLIFSTVFVSVILVAVLVNSVSTGTPFLNVPARVLFVLPSFAIALGAGFAALAKTRYVRWVLTGVIAIAWIVGNIDYYTEQQFVNPNYIIPARAVAAQIAMEAGPQDLVIGEWDSGFSYYFERSHASAPYRQASESGLTDWLANHSFRRIWLVTIGRDRTRENTPVELVQWLEQNKHLAQERGYVEQDSTYRRLKELLLRRPAYQYKLDVRRYDDLAQPVSNQ